MPKELSVPSKFFHNFPLENVQITNLRRSLRYVSINCSSGYMSPEYAFHGEFSEKSDVYSYRVRYSWSLLFEREPLVSIHLNTQNTF